MGWEGHEPGGSEEVSTSSPRAGMRRCSPRRSQPLPLDSASGEADPRAPCRPRGNQLLSRGQQEHTVGQGSPKPGRGPRVAWTRLPMGLRELRRGRLREPACCGSDEGEHHQLRDARHARRTSTSRRPSGRYRRPGVSAGRKRVVLGCPDDQAAHRRAIEVGVLVCSTVPGREGGEVDGCQHAGVATAVRTSKRLEGGTGVAARTGASSGRR